MILSVSYLLNLIADKNIASVTPTSRFGVRRLCNKINFKTAKTIVEYGPATGVFTRYLLERMNPDARLIAIDTNEKFLSILREKISDPRLTIVHDSAANVREILAAQGLGSADYVISGIPFTFLLPEVADQIVKTTKELLTPNGKFLVYQFLKPEKDTNLGIHRYLPPHFNTIVREAEWLNIPPLRVYEAVKN